MNALHFKVNPAVQAGYYGEHPLSVLQKGCTAREHRQGFEQFLAWHQMSDVIYIKL